MLTGTTVIMTATIREAATREDIAFARALFVEYAKWLQVDLCFQDFDRELATLPGAYARPRGRLLLAGEPGEAFACIALRPLVADVALPLPPGSVGEVKRLYVQPAARNEGWGGRLVTMLVDQARTIGYAELKLDTLDWMDRRTRALCEARLSRVRGVLRQSASRRRLHVTLRFDFAVTLSRSPKIFVSPSGASSPTHPGRLADRDVAIAGISQQRDDLVLAVPRHRERFVLARRDRRARALLVAALDVDAPAIDVDEDFRTVARSSCRRVA